MDVDWYEFHLIFVTSLGVVIILLLFQLQFVHHFVHFLLFLLLLVSSFRPSGIMPPSTLRSGFALFLLLVAADRAEGGFSVVEVGGGIAQTSTIRWNFSATVAPNIANHIPILKPLRYSSKWVWGLLCLEQRLPRNSNG